MRPCFFYLHHMYNIPYFSKFFNRPHQSLWQHTGNLQNDTCFFQDFVTSGYIYIYHIMITDLNLFHIPLRLVLSSLNCYYRPVLLPSLQCASRAEVKCLTPPNRKKILLLLLASERSQEGAIWWQKPCSTFSNVNTAKILNYLLDIKK